MIDPEVQHLRKVAESVPDHLPLLSAVYDKTLADSVVEYDEYSALTDDEWKQVYEDFLHDIDVPSGVMWEAFVDTVMNVVRSRKED